VSLLVTDRQSSMNYHSNTQTQIISITAAVWHSDITVRHINEVILPNSPQNAYIHQSYNVTISYLSTVY